MINLNRLVTLKLTLQVFQADGVLKSTEEYASDSYLKAFLCGLCASFGYSPGTCNDINGVPWTIQWETASARASSWFIDNKVGNNLVGIQVGSNANAVDLFNFHLIGLIENGTLSGQMEWRDQTRPKGPTLYDTWGDFKIQRCFVNNSGGSVYVNETGICARFDIVEAGLSNFLIVRDSGFNTKIVSDGECLCVTYDFQIWL